MNHKIKRLFINLPEYYLLILIFMASITPPFSFNAFVLVLGLVPILQIIFQNNALGFITASIFILLNLFFFGALISEFIEFPSFTSSAMQLLFVGLSVCLLNMIVAFMMIRKYSTKEVPRYAQMR